LTALASLNISVGVLIGYSLGAVFYWPVVAILCALIPLVSVALTLIYLPETPTWYLTKRRRKEANDALRAVRDPDRSDSAIKRELDHLGGVLDSAPDWNKWRELRKGSSMKPLALVTFYFFTYQFSGKYMTYKST
jgi:Sugar (and other) transporter